MEKQRITFRITDDAEKKLTQLLEMDTKLATVQNRDPHNRTRIINEVIVSCYMTKSADQYTDPYIARMEIAFERIFRKYMTALVHSNNTINRLSRESKEYMLLLCKGLNIDRARDGVENLIYMTMPWDIRIPEKVARDLNVKEPAEGNGIIL